MDGQHEKGGVSFRVTKHGALAEAKEKETPPIRILPPYMRRSPKVAEVLPVLYLRGLSTGDFKPALTSLLGEDAGLSATNISRFTMARGSSWAARTACCN